MLDSRAKRVKTASDTDSLMPTSSYVVSPAHVPKPPMNDPKDSTGAYYLIHKTYRLAEAAAAVLMDNSDVLVASAETDTGVSRQPAATPIGEVAANVQIRPQSVVCYVCRLPTVPGKFDRQKAKALGVPMGPLCGAVMNLVVVSFI